VAKREERGGKGIATDIKSNVIENSSFAQENGKGLSRTYFSRAPDDGKRRSLRQFWEEFCP